MMDLLFTSLFGSETKDPVKMKGNWIWGNTNAYEEARRIVPEEQQLEFSLEQGWEQLCEFLGTKVAKAPFPHENDANSYDTGIQVLFRIMWIRAAKSNAPFR